ncbi:MAG: RloB family protein [Sediminibacterium sp.]|nr:RloB family protein [Sediminibacterium sp.]
MAKRGKISKTKYAGHKKEDARPSRLRKYKYLFLIVCEDTKTEPAYFEQFKINFPPETLYLECVGTGFDPLGVVRKCIEEKAKLKELRKMEVDKVWVVFDKDDADDGAKKEENFNLAFEDAERENIEIAYSNEVFELWLLLHLTEVKGNKPLSRNEIYKALEAEVKTTNRYDVFTYDHKKPDNRILDIIRMEGSETKAMKRAEELLKYHSKIKPIKANPSTRVHVLVNEIRSWEQYYNFK